MRKWWFFLIVLFIVPLVFGTIKLTLWCTGGTEREGLEAAIAEYKKIRPDVEIELVGVPYAEFDQKLKLAILSGNVPDLVTVTYPYAPGYMKYMVDLSPYVKEVLGITPQEFANTVYEVVKTRILDEKEAIRYVPLTFTVQCLWINVDYFKKAGIPYPPLGGRIEPWTWEEFMDILKKVKTANNIPYALSMQRTAERLFAYLAIRGVKILDEQLNFTLDKDPKAKQLLQDFVNMFKENIMVPAEWIAAQDPNMAFTGGLTAVLWAGSWSTLDLLKVTDKKFAPVFLPKDVYWLSLEGGHLLGVFKTGDKTREKASAEFALWVGWKGGGSDICLKTAYQLSPYKNHKVAYGNPIMDHVQEVCGKLAEATPGWVAKVRSSEIWSKLQTPINNQMSAVVAGQISLDEALKNLRNEYERIVKELGGKK